MRSPWLRLAGCVLILACFVLYLPASAADMLVGRVLVSAEGEDFWLEAWPGEQILTKDKQKIPLGIGIVLGPGESKQLVIKGTVYYRQDFKLNGKAVPFASSGEFGPVPLDTVSGVGVHEYKLDFEARKNGVLKHQIVVLKIITGEYEHAPLPKAKVTVDFAAGLPAGYKPGLDPVTIDVRTPDPLDPLAPKWTLTTVYTPHGGFEALIPLEGGKGHWISTKPKPIKLGKDEKPHPFYPTGGAVGLVNDSGTKACLGNSQVVQDLSGPWFEPVKIPPGSLSVGPEGSYNFFFGTIQQPFTPIEGQPSYPQYKVYLGYNGLLDTTPVAEGIGSWGLQPCPGGKFLLVNEVSTYAEESIDYYLVEGTTARQLSGVELYKTLYGSLAAAALVENGHWPEEPSLTFKFAADGGVLVCSGPDGRYLLHCPGGGESAGPEGSGTETPSKPRPSWQLTLACPAKVLPAPFIKGATSKVRLQVTVKDSKGKPGAKVPVLLSVEEPVPWLKLTPSKVVTNAAGLAQVTVELSPSFQGLDLTKGPPVVKFIAKAGDDSNTRPAELKRPLEAAVIAGTYVGADMKPRELSVLPTTAPRTCLLATQLKGPKFLLLVSTNPRFKSASLVLNWPKAAPCPLRFTVEQSLETGKVYDLGPFDLLTPAEHEQRLRNLLREFALAMHLTPTGRGMLLKHVNNFRFKAGAPLDSVPHFEDGFIGSDVIMLPGENENYWFSRDPNDPDLDPSYTIIFHEFGHLVHHSLIERHYYLNMIYHSIAACTHNTWKVPMADPNDVDWRIKLTGATASARRYTAFSESNADFFAWLMHHFWLSRHPECKDSLYNRRGYLADFDTTTKADDALKSGAPGQQIEGVCTRFLLSLYGQRCAANVPALVYSDYLATMLQYRRECYIYKRAARTLEEWVTSRKDYGSPLKLADAYDLQALAKRYRLFSNTPQPKVVVTPLTKGETPAGASLKVDSKPLDLNAKGVNVVKSGSTLEATQGDFLLTWPEGSGQPKQVLLKQGAKLVIEGGEAIALQQGTLGAEGKLQLLSPRGKVKPLHTAYVASLTPSGELEVAAVEGEVSLEASGETSPHLLKAPEGAQVDAKGLVAPLGGQAQQALAATVIGGVADEVQSLFGPPPATPPAVTPPATPSTPGAARPPAAGSSAGDFDASGWLQLTGSPLVRLSLCRSLGPNNTPVDWGWKYPSTIQELVLLFELKGMAGPRLFEADLYYKGYLRTTLRGTLNNDGLYTVRIVPREIPRFPPGDYKLLLKLENKEVFTHAIKVQ